MPVELTIVEASGQVLAVGGGGVIIDSATAPGPPGPPGADGTGDPVTGTVTVADDVWLITHGLGREPIVMQFYDPDGAELEPGDYQHPDANTTLALWPTAQAGSWRFA